MTPTFIALGIFIIIAGLAIHVWYSDQPQQAQRPYGLRIFLDGVELTGYVSEINKEWPVDTAVHIQDMQFPTFSATITWDADAPIKVIYPEVDHE